MPSPSGGTDRIRTYAPTFADERISNPLHYRYAYCSVLPILRISANRFGSFFLAGLCWNRPAAFYVSAHKWRKMEDSNPQETIADLHVGFLDRCPDR